MPRPAGFPDHDVEIERGEIVCVGIGLGVLGQIDHLRIGLAVVAGLRLDDARSALDLLQ